MKKIFLTILLIMSVFMSTCFAKEPVISSDSKTFNPLTGVYELTGHVYVELESQGQPIIIKGDHAKVMVYNLEVHADKNISLTFGKLNFLCDNVDVYIGDKTAFVNGNCKFKDDRITSTSNKGSYNWQSKLAVFSGDVKLNGSPVDGDVKYNVENGKIEK